MQDVRLAWRRWPASSVCWRCSWRASVFTAFTAYAVARRREEIGIRMALGASPARVVHMVVLRLVFLVGSGAFLGLGMGVWFGQSIASLLYGIEPHDSMTMASSALTLAVVGTLAAWLPAWRASRLDPADVLRET